MSYCCLDFVSLNDLSYRDEKYKRIFPLDDIKRIFLNGCSNKCNKNNYLKFEIFFRTIHLIFYITFFPCNKKKNLKNSFEFLNDAINTPFPPINVFSLNKYFSSFNNRTS